ncbi:MAG: hypothetical protein JWM74_3709, partial [Myxococcaceae bacterium]|nr:hypothetical protein [Myxococcaceae bacterium]
MRASVFGLGLAGLLLTSAAHAQSADELFQQGVQLFARGETKVACDKFAASYKLDPAPGTLYNLAGCHEKDGRLGLARQEFRELVERATQAGKADKAEVARQRAEAIESHLPKIALTFGAGANATEIVVDGQPLAKEAWQKPIVAEAGAHTVDFKAPGKTPATRKVTTAGEASTALEVPTLVDANAPATPPPPPPTSDTLKHDHVEPPPEPASGGGTRTLGFIVGGAGIAVLGVGTVFGIMALGQ